jgi:hypothetical protein
MINLQLACHLTDNCPFLVENQCTDLFNVAFSCQSAKQSDCSSSLKLLHPFLHMSSHSCFSVAKLCHHTALIVEDKYIITTVRLHACGFLHSAARPIVREKLTLRGTILTYPCSMELATEVRY